MKITVYHTQIDLSAVDPQLISIFGGLYLQAELDWGERPSDLPPQRQKKVRQQLERRFRWLSFPSADSFESCFAPEVSDSEVLTFLECCYEQSKLNERQAKESFDRSAGALTEEARDALWKALSTFEYNVDYRIREGALEIVFDACACVMQKVILTDIEKISRMAACSILSLSDFEVADDRYRLRVRWFDTESEEERFGCLTFSDVHSETVVLKADCNDFDSHPWGCLGMNALSIVQKADISIALLNTQERELLPLLKEIASFTAPLLIGEAICQTFPILRALFTERSFKKPLRTLESLEQAEANSPRYRKLAERLETMLNEQAYEQLWRALYDQISASQADYPEQVNETAHIDKIEDIRHKIEAFMVSEGYSGSYPHFIKKGSQRAIRLAESYGQSYFVGMEKDVVYHVHCFESRFEETFAISLVSGTALLRKGEQAEDIYACLFSANGRRLFKTLQYDWDLEDEVDYSALALLVSVAVKSAELRSLNKQERGFRQSTGGGLSIFLATFLIMGGMYAILMTAGFMLIELLISLFTGQLAAFPELFAASPWWLILVMAWVGFGGAMGLVSILSKRK